MITMEQVEKLRQYGNISFEDAKNALEQAEGNMLDAVIFLEKNGKISPPSSETGHSAESGTANPVNECGRDNKCRRKHHSEESFRSCIGGFLKWCGRVLHKGNINTFNVSRFGEHLFSLPITILVVLILCFFWIVFPLLVLGLFFSFRYSFHGPDLGSPEVNNVADTMADAAVNIKKSIKDAADENKNRKNSDN